MIVAGGSWSIHIGDGLTPQDAAQLREAMYAFNVDVTGFDDGAGLGCVIRDADGALVAGLDGFTWGGYARLEYVWVTEAVRGSGLGTALVEAAIEEARARGCRTVIVDSHTFQAPEFYQRLGFVEVGRTTNTPAGHDQVLMQLELRG